MPTPNPTPPSRLASSPTCSSTDLDAAGPRRRRSCLAERHAVLLFDSSPDVLLYVAVVPILLPKGSTEPRLPSSLQRW